MFARRGSVVLIVAVPLAIVAACGGSVSGETSGDSGSGAAGSGGSLVGGSGGSGGIGGTGGGTGGIGGKLDAGSDAGSGGTGGYIDPGCPDAQAPPPEFECDPLGPNTCPPGQACFPFIIYPSKPCDFEVYGASCGAAGVAQQGDPCGQTSPGSVSLCAPGLSCFITGMGTECLELCETSGPSTCPPGLLCQSTDVEGIGACN
jgi:hypothetical protein